MLQQRAADVSALSSPGAHEKTEDMSRQQVQIPCPPMISSVFRGGAESAHPKRIRYILLTEEEQGCSALLILVQAGF